jgi:pimeloyl-ACP methyl ester carboxylesterase
VAAELRRRGFEAVVPELPANKDEQLPYWQQDASAVAEVIKSLPGDRAFVLVGHSGAGMLLPAIRQLAERQPAGYIFADAGIPNDGKSRLDLLKLELPEVGEMVEQPLREGERLPQWSDDDLSMVVADAGTRRVILGELRPQGLAFYTEPIPVFAGWPDAPCAYLQFSQGYDHSAAQARQMGWPVRNLDAGHFHLLVEPVAVMDTLVEFAKHMMSAS